MCDMSWKQLQNGPVYVFRPRIGYQRVSPSDLGGKTNEYLWQLQCPSESDDMADQAAVTVYARKHPLPAHPDVYQAIQVARAKDKFRQVLRLYEVYDWSNYTGPGFDFGLWDELSITVYYLQRKELGDFAFRTMFQRLDYRSVEHLARWHSQQKRLRENLRFHNNPTLQTEFEALTKRATVISAEVMGGLGNQLFQIATALALSYDVGCQALFERITASASSIGTRP